MDPNIADVGMAAGAIAVVSVVFNKLPTLISVVKGDSDKPPDRYSVSLDNNTQAICNLNQFLQVRAGIEDTREGQRAKQLDTVETKVDTLTSAVSEHCIKCNEHCR